MSIDIEVVLITVCFSTINWLLGYKAGKERGWKDAHIQFIKTQRKEPPHAAD